MGSRNFTQTLLERLRELPAGKLAEVEDFVDFLLRQATAKRRFARRPSAPCGRGRAAPDGDTRA
jgi:hypothetical protein